MSHLPHQPTATVHRARAVATLLVAVLVAVLLPAGAARAAEGSDLTRWIGDERAAAGIGGLQVASDLVEVATRHAQRMAAEGRLHHNPALTSEVSGWERLTENVGHGPDARRVHDGFMASSSHRANILDTGVTQVGVGVAWKDGSLWVAQVFRRPSASSAPTPPPAPSPAPAPSTPSPPPSDSHPPPPPPTPRASSSDLGLTRVSEQTVILVHDVVSPAPAPAVTVATADDGQVALVPVPFQVRVLTAARWLVVLQALADE